jgi:two-component system aerobic respiration control protein ArcA
MSKRVDLKSFVSELGEKLRERVTESGVVSFEAMKSLKKKAPKKILIVEDDHFVREGLRRTLELDGHRVTLVADGVELMALIEEFPFDLILMDVGLPWLNGYELAELLQADSEMRKIPIVFISGHSDIIDIRRGFKVGAGDYITKPFEIDNVRKTVNTLMELNS